MDSFDLSKAPVEFQEWGTTFWVCNLYVDSAWLIVYVGMIQRSVQDQSYAMPLLSQCFNLAWEITFGFIYPADHWVLMLAFRLAVIINSAVTYTAIRYGSREWDRSPIVKRNLPIIYAVGIGTSVACYMGIVEQLGRSKACFMIAIILQAILSVGSLCQLLTRGSTRGYSFSLWFWRFSGSLVLVPEFYLRFQHWHEDFEFLGTPFMLWCCCIFLGFDLAYGLCFWYIEKHEQGDGMVRVQKNH